MRTVVEDDPRQRAWEHALEPAIIDDSDAMMHVDTRPRHRSSRSQR